MVITSILTAHTSTGLGSFCPEGRWVIRETMYVCFCWGATRVLQPRKQCVTTANFSETTPLCVYLGWIVFSSLFSEISDSRLWHDCHSLEAKFRYFYPMSYMQLLVDFTNCLLSFQPLIQRLNSSLWSWREWREITRYISDLHLGWPTMRHKKCSVLMFKKSVTF